MFSLWFPLLTTLAAAWVILFLMPTLLGSPLDNLARFQPDLGMLFILRRLAEPPQRRRDLRIAELVAR